MCNHVRESNYIPYLDGLGSRDAGFRATVYGLRTGFRSSAGSFSGQAFSGLKVRACGLLRVRARASGLSLGFRVGFGSGFGFRVRVLGLGFGF